MKVNEILRTLRQRRKLSLQNLADELGISYSTYQSYESNDGNKIQLNTLETIAKFHSMSLVELIAFEENEKGSYIYEPPTAYGKKSDVVKIIVDLDGTDSTIQKWFAKLEKLNAAI